MKQSCCDGKLAAMLACFIACVALTATAQAQAKPEAKTEVKPAARAEAKPEVEAEAKPDPKAVAEFEAGIAAYQANDLPLAYKQFLKAANRGHADSQFNVALMHEQGIGVGKDEKQAVVWYRKSALLGNSAAQFNLAVLYENGRGTKVDFAKAHQWYRRASVQGDALAIGNLGMLYVRGQGVKENKIAGVALLLMSATQDRSPQNNARQNISGTRGLNAEMIGAAQTLSVELSRAKNLLIPLDQYLKQPAKK